MILDYFDAGFVINLDQRQDRMERFLKRIKTLNFNQIQRFSGIMPNDGAFSYMKYYSNDKFRKYKAGCTLSHLSLYKIAKDNKYKSILIFEDDCVFHENFTEKINLYISDLKSIEWDLFYLGGQPIGKGTNISNNLIKVDGVYSTHAYAINDCFYETALSLNPNYIDAIDIGLLHSKAKNIICKEVLCWQEGGYSDCHGQVSDSRQILENAYKNL